MSKIRSVTDHAILRYIERNVKVIDDIESDIIRKIEETGEEVKPRFSGAKLAKNNNKPVRYIKCKKLVFVVSIDGIVITTLNYTPNSFIRIKTQKR